MTKLTSALAVTAALIAVGAASAATPAKPVASAKKPAAAKAHVTPVKAKPAAKPAAKTLAVGDPAPALKVAKWLKGQPVSKFENGKIYVVEFWATWCPPCRESIPHMTELAKKYGDVTFIGVDVFDNTDAQTQTPYKTLAPYQEKVAAFVKEQGDKMVYSVGIDDLKNTMGDSWMKAAKQPGIPTAFVVGKDGKLLLISHPMELDQYLDQIVAGTFDPKAVAKKKADEEAEAAKFEKAMAKAGELYGASKFKEALVEVDKVIAANPEYEPKIAAGKFMILTQTDEPAAYAYARKVMDGCCKDDPMVSNVIAGTILNSPELKSPDYDLALMAAEKTDKLTKSENPMVIATLALAHFKKGNVDKAIELQQTAIKLAEADKNAPAEYVTQMKSKLTEFQNKKDGK